MPTQVHFYIVKHDDDQPRYELACQLADRALDHARLTAIQVDHANDKTRLDALLWAFAPTSFVPHRLLPCDGQALSGERVVIGLAEEIAQLNQATYLINLSLERPKHLEQFQTIDDIALTRSDQINPARQRYRHYRQQGCHLQHIERTPGD